MSEFAVAHLEEIGEMSSYLEADSDLDPLRGEVDFQALLSG